MGDILEAFIEFFVDLFSALSTFLGNDSLDLAGVIESFMGGDDTSSTSGDSGTGTTGDNTATN